MQALRTAALVAALLFAGVGCSSDDSQASDAISGGSFSPSPSTNPAPTITNAPSPSTSPIQPSNSVEVSPTAAPSTFGPFEASSEPGVSLIDIGWTSRRTYDGYFAHTGAVFYNNGPEVPSVNVIFQGIHNDEVVDSATSDFYAIPADSFFVMGQTMTEMRGAGDTVEVVIGTVEDWDQPPAGAGDVSVMATAPRASGVYENISLQVQNEGTVDVQDSAVAHVILLDEEGNIIGGSNDFTNVPVASGQTVRDVIPDVFSPRGTSQALAYLDLFELTY